MVAATGAFVEAGRFASRSEELAAHEEGMRNTLRALVARRRTD
jgi:hypothetical protein